MSRRRGRRSHRRCRAKPVASPPAFVKSVDHAFDPLVGQRRISLFKSVVITSLFLLAMTTVVVVSIAIDVSTNTPAGEPANLPPYGAWEDDNGHIGTPLKQRTRVKRDDNTPAHHLPDGMTPAHDPATERLREVLRVRYRVAVIHGETEMYKILYKYLVDSPHTQKPTVRPGYGEPSGYEAWDYLTTGENHAFNSPIRTRRRVGKPWSVSHHENDSNTLESKRRSDTEDGSRYDVTDDDLKAGDNDYNYKHPRVRDLIVEVISDSEILDAIVARHHTDEVPISPTEDELARSKNMAPDNAAFVTPPATKLIHFTPKPRSGGTKIPDAIVARHHTDEVPITPTDDKLARSKNMTAPDETSAFNAPPGTKVIHFTPKPHSYGTNIPDATVARHHTDEVAITLTENKMARSKDMTSDKTSAFNAPPATNVTQFDNDVNNTDTAASVARHLSEVPMTPTQDNLARSKDMTPADETSSFNVPPATTTTRFYCTHVPIATSEGNVLDGYKDMTPFDETSAFNAPPATNVTQLTPKLDSDANNTDMATEIDKVPQKNGTDLSLYPSSEVAMPMVVVGALVTGSIAYSCMMQLNY